MFWDKWPAETPLVYHKNALVYHKNAELIQWHNGQATPQLSFMTQKGVSPDLSPSRFCFEFLCFSKLRILLKLDSSIDEMCQSYDIMHRIMNL
jgi:hypothetical protein